MIGTSHDQPHRTHACRWLSALALGLFSLNAQAGYANAVPPSGWSAGTGAGATYRAAANEAWLSSTVRTNASLNVGGKAVQVPATMRLAANAPRFAARFLFGNPLIAVGSIALTAWLASGNLRWNATEQRWEQSTTINGDQTIETYGWRVNGSTSDYLSYPSQSTACSAAGAWWKANVHERATSSGSGAGCGIYIDGNPVAGAEIYSKGIQTIPVSSERIDPVTSPSPFEEIMAPKPLPDLQPNELPTPLPVLQPKLNPIPSPDGQPSPLRIPDGDPYPVPNTDPQRYQRPVTDIVPSPTPTEPWRMDVQPRVIDTPSLDPNVLPSPNPSTDPAPKTDDKEDLCQKNPDILACQKPELDTPDQEIPRRDFAVTFVAETLFGTGACPADRTMNFRGQTLTVWDFGKTCDYLTTYLKPVLILLATFSAFMIISPGKEA